MEIYENYDLPNNSPYPILTLYISDRMIKITNGQEYIDKMCVIPANNLETAVMIKE